MTYINAAHGNDQVRVSILLCVQSQPRQILDARAFRSRQQSTRTIKTYFEIAALLASSSRAFCNYLRSLTVRRLSLVGMGLALGIGKLPASAMAMVANMDNKKRILIVDDDETVRLSYRRSLADMPWDIAAARNGDEALRAMQANPSDVVLLDLRMPGPDGLSVLGTIKRKWPDSEVVVITGYPSLDSAVTAVRLGAQNYAVKPVGPEEVVDLATAAMNRKGWAMHRVPDPGGPYAS